MPAQAALELIRVSGAGGKRDRFEFRAFSKVWQNLESEMDLVEMFISGYHAA